MMFDDMSDRELALEARARLVGFEAIVREGLARAVSRGDNATAGKIGAMQHEAEQMHRRINRILKDLPEVQAYFGGDK